MPSERFFYLILLSLSFTASHILAQPANKYISDATVPAPNAGALGKYGDIPVSYFTGVPDIGIPIYTVQEGPLSLPISLSYHASGTKVAELASWVGMGWSLNAGGIITRVVQGLPDETAATGYYNYGQYLPPPNDPNITSFLVSAGNGSYDTEPDLFTFNVAGYTGKFYIDHKNATAVGKPAYQLIPQQDLKIEFTTDFTRFILLAPDGTRYTFGKSVVNGSDVDAREFTHQFGEASWKTFCSSWYLIQVESPDRKFSISLSYANDTYAYMNLAPCTWVEIMEGCPPNYGSSGSTGYQCSGTSGIDTYHNGFTTEVTGKRLSSINFSTGAVTFNATVNRQDLDAQNGANLDAKRLESIQIATGTPELACKKFEFSYDYFQDPAKTASYAKRLRLLQIQEKSCDGTLVVPAYVFNYNGSFLPYRLSKSTDHWGFYNGATQNETQIVSIPPTTLPVLGMGTYRSYGAANKETNVTEMKKGILTDITYPTGGKTFFTYEANTVYQSLPTTLVKLTLQSCNDLPANCCGTRTGTSGLIQFTAAELANNNTKFKAQLWNIPNQGFPPPTCINQPASCIIQAYNANGTPLGSSVGFNIPANFGTDSIVQNLSALGNFQPNTNYYFTIQSTNGYSTLTINSTTSVWQNYTVGGLRIKQIRTSESGVQTANDIIKNYEYLQTDNTTSSGVIYKTAKYGNNITGTAQLLTPTGTNYDGFYRMFFSEQPVFPLYNFEGYSCGYARVKEQFNGNGEKVYEFSYIQNYNNYTNSNVYPNQPDQPTVSLGKPAKESAYNSTGTLQAQTISAGGESSISSINAGYIYKIVNSSYTCFDPPNNSSFGATGVSYAFYNITTNWYKLTATSETLDGVTTATSYEYDSQNRFYAPTATQITNSDGKTNRTEYKYPHDLTAGCLRDSLLRKNMIAAPWQTIVKVSNVQVDGSETVFGAYNLTTGAFSSATACATGTFPRPYQVKRYEVTWNNGVITTGSWVTKGTFNSYNTKGKPASFTTANWADPETYTWNTAGLILTRTFKSHAVSYDYYPGTRLLRLITDIDGRKTGFTYDKLMRLAKATKDNAGISGETVSDGNVKTEYTYHYKIVADPFNRIKTKTTFTHTSGSGLDSTIVFEYFDGIGRGLQTVKKAWSPAQKDVVAGVLYDNQGRLSKEYTPFETTNNNGAFATVPGSQPHTLYQYEASPLNRTISLTPPGWYATTTAYSGNAANEVGYYNGSSATSYYPANSLNKTTITTPQSSAKNLETITYTDKKGRVLLTRRKESGSSTNIADTYSLYDDKDRVNRVLPPGVSTGASEASLRFDYVYDAADRMTSKKVPDAAAVTMKYNNRDQLVLSQDGNLLAAGKWMLVKYDDYGRPISSGLHTGANPDPNNTGLAYNEQHTATTYGTSGVELGKIKTAQSWMPGGASITRTYTYSTITGRMLTDNGANHLNGNTGSDNYTYAYDYAGNLLSETRAHKTSSASATLTLLTRRAYDHSGRNTALYHKINTNAEKQLAKYVYDFRDRLIDKSLDSVRVGSVSSWLQSIDYAYNEQNWLTSINSGSSFGALSQDAIALCSTNPGTPNPAETAYATNPDGNDLFKVDLYYDSPGLTFGSPAPNGQRNGNISQLVWQTRGRQRQGYTLQYDYLDRLTTAYYADINSAGTATTDNKYQENISYADARGNIQSINRRGMYKDPFGATCFTNGVIDNLTYTYNYASNRIQKIADATANTAAKAQGFNPGNAGGTSTYSYDANGNLISDPYKGISGMTVTYNHLNLPSLMSFGSNGSLAILYDHAGKKLRKTVSPTTSTGYTQDYVSGLEYRTNGGGGTLTLEAIYHAEGRVTPLSGSNYQYEYTIKDHLGNARLSFADLNANSIVDVPGDILQENHYYPFGMNMNYGWMNATALDNRYQYNGKELNDDFGLNWNDYGARWYDAAVGRFPSVDPIIDKFPYLTPYNYASNSPVAKIDLYGLQGIPTTADGVWQYMWSSTGLTNDWGGIDKVKQLAKDVVIESGKIIATMAIIEIATPVIIEALGVEGGEAIALTTSAIRAERSVANTIVPAANSEVRQAALNRAVVEVETSAKPPTMTAAVRDAETGKIYTDVSGKPHPILSKDLQKQAPNPSKEPWPPCNCAETKAANQAVKDGAKLKNLEHHTVRTKTGQMAPPCRNCRETLKQSTHVKN